MIKSQILPYQKNSLDPTLSQETLDFHYNKHHLGYEKKLNSLIVSTKYENDALNKIIIESYKSRDKAIYNNAAQVWNHNFYWSSLNVKSNIPNKIFQLIKKYFKNVNAFNNDLINKGMSLFGSGWLWLIQNKTSGKLSLITTSNADNPLLLLDVVPILTIDLWEHAYYIDYRNDRKTYLNNVVKHLNWNFANNNLIN